jgi:hypothetical protein
MANVGEVYEYRIYCTAGTQTSINVRHLKLISFTGTPPVESSFPASLVTLYQTAYVALMQAGSNFAGISVTKVDPAPLGVTFVSLGGTAGGVAGDPLPTQCSGLITLRALTGGRHGRGRVYIPFPSEASSTTSPQPTPVAGYMTSLTTLSALFVNTILFGAVGNQWTAFPGVYERATRIFHTMATATGIPKWATQRRRGSFGRPNSPPF